MPIVPGGAIWLTGSRGFIGTPLVRVLSAAGLNVRCFTNTASDIGKRPDGRPQCVRLDYLKAEDIQRQADRWGLPDVFLHLGWGAMEDPESPVHLEENVRTAQTLIRTLFELGVQKFVFLGSMNEYGGRVGSLAEYMEPEGRLTNYARGKIQVRAFGLATAERLKRTFIHIRSFYVYGAGQRAGSLINELYRCHREGSDVHLGPCEHYRDYIHVSDVVEGIRRLMDLETSATVNLGSGRAIKLKNFVQLFWQRLGGENAKLKFGYHPMRAGEPEQPRSYADLTRLKALTGWAPSRTLEEGVDLTIHALEQWPSHS